MGQEFLFLIKGTPHIIIGIVIGVVYYINIMSTTSVGIKRKRSKAIGLNNLSNDILRSVADYLPKTSRALLAVSLMKNNEPSTTSKAIISSSLKGCKSYENIREEVINEQIELSCELDDPSVLSYRNYKPQLWVVGINDATKTDHIVNELDHQISQYYDGGWEILDFVDIPKSLASRLTDDDLAAILKCIDAKTNLKRLILTHCFNIVGQGLSPLRGSVVLEKLDLGLVRQMEVPQAFNDVQLSEEAVYDILNGILSVEGNTFKRLHIPLAWSNDNNGKPRPSERLSSLFNDMQTSSFMNAKNLCAYFGFDNSKSLIEQFDNDDVDKDEIDSCFGCNEHGDFVICNICNEVKCYGCGEVCTCTGEECNNITCDDCRGDENVVVVNNCVNWCDNEWCDARCGDCRFRECCDGTLDCDDCKSKVFDRLLLDNNAKKTEIEQLQRELNQLRC